MSSGYDPRHAGDPRHGNWPTEPVPSDGNAGGVPPQQGQPDAAPAPYGSSWSGTPPQRYAAQPYEGSPYARASYGSQPTAPSPYASPNGTAPYAGQSGAPSPYAPSPYAQPQAAPSPYAPSPYAPSPYAQPPAARSPYAPAAYAPVAYVPVAGATPWDAKLNEPKGKPMLTPFRVVIFIALVVSASIAAYSLLVARGSQVIPVTVAALAVFAIAAALLGINLGAGAMGSARNGHLGRSIVGALFGGVLCLAAAGGASAAIILGMLARS